MCLVLTQPSDIAMGMGKALGALAAVQLALLPVTGTRDPLHLIRTAGFPVSFREYCVIEPRDVRHGHHMSAARENDHCMLAGPAMADLLPKTATSESARKALNAKTSALPSLKQTAENAGEALSGDVDLQSNVQRVGASTSRSASMHCRLCWAAAPRPLLVLEVYVLSHQCKLSRTTCPHKTRTRLRPLDIWSRARRLARTSRTRPAATSAARQRATCVPAGPSRSRTVRCRRANVQLLTNRRAMKHSCANVFVCVSMFGSSNMFLKYLCTGKGPPEQGQVGNWRRPRQPGGQHINANLAMCLIETHIYKEVKFVKHKTPTCLMTHR